MDSKRILIVGGSGFVGQNITEVLSKKGFTILILDFSPSPSNITSLPNVSFAKIDLMDVEELEKRVSNFKPVLVIHLASWGMSGEGMLSELCQKINVQGTANLLDICLKHNISKFVYTSSYNVVFGGKEIKNGDETYPYFPENEQVDQYSSSKTRAERLVMQANGTTTKDGSLFMSSSIRPCAIYGEGELRHLPRIVKHMDNGLFLMRIGTAIVDWVHIDNLISAFLLLLDKMLTSTDPQKAPAGQAYFISDGTPIDNFLFLRPLCLARKRKFPTNVVIPTGAMLALSWTLEKLYFLSVNLAFPIKLVPMLTRAEVLKVGVTHHFSIDKARRELGYSPAVTSLQGGERIAAYYADRERLNNKDFFEIAHIVWYFLIILGMTLLGLTAFCSPQYLQHSNAFLSAVNWLALTIFRSQQILKYVFIAAVGAHVIESLQAFNLCLQLRCDETKYMWVAQTLLLGYPSLKLLYDRQKVMKEV